MKMKQQNDLSAGEEKVVRVSQTFKFKKRCQRGEKKSTNKNGTKYTYISGRTKYLIFMKFVKKRNNPKLNDETPIAPQILTGNITHRTYNSSLKDSKSLPKKGETLLLFHIADKIQENLEFNKC